MGLLELLLIQGIIGGSSSPVQEVEVQWMLIRCYDAQVARIVMKSRQDLSAEVEGKGQRRKSGRRETPSILQ